MSRLENKVAVITGAASGIGRATAIRFAKEGAAVVVADLNAEGGEATAHECVANDGRALFIKTDVSREDDIKAAIALAVKQYGALHITFNNAGLGGAVGLLEETTVENWDRTQAILLRGVFLGIKHSIPEMRKAGGGSIINTASVAGLNGGYGPHSYSAAKAGVINLTRNAALELGKDRIRVNCICPGGINTPLLYGRVPGDGERLMDRLMAQAQPIKRAGAAHDIAGMALYLASDDAEWVTGTAMVVDGGLTAGGQFLERPGAQPITIPGNFAGPSFEK